MTTTKWKQEYPKGSDNWVTDFNWYRPGGGIWEARPASNNDAEPEPGTGWRNKNTIACFETPCNFGDFSLKFSFRCPNNRGNPPNWTDCNSAIKGPRNWGNSGIYIFNLYEVQIRDSYDAGEITTNPNDKTNLGGCQASGTNPVKMGELCAAIYGVHVPVSNNVKQATGHPSPDGAWNTMQIWFMSPRFATDANGNPNWNSRQKKATISVKLNNVLVHNKVGLNCGTGNTRSSWPENKYWEKGKRDKLYTSLGKKWVQTVGPIMLQEHDNRVQFTGIEVNRGWYPESGGTFDPTWQVSG